MTGPALLAQFTGKLAPAAILSVPTTPTFLSLPFDLRTEYLHWKQPHPTTTDVAEEDQAARRTTPYSLRDTIRRTFKSKVGELPRQRQLDQMKSVP
jgi:hypothetical protein